MNDYSFPRLSYDPSNVYGADSGLAPDHLVQLGDRLKLARDEMLSDLDALRSGDPARAIKQPLDVGFIDLPDRLLADYRNDPKGSELGRILAAAENLRANLDRIVVIGIGGSYMGTRSLFEALCHPNHNELSRTERRQRPRLYFIGYNVDNDTAQGLLDVLGRGRTFQNLEERWGIIGVSKSGETLEPAIAFRQFLKSLRQAAEGTEWAHRAVKIVTGPGSRLHRVAELPPSMEVFEIPSNVGGRYSIFTACGLLPAAVVGIDVVKLLEGASASTASFRSETLPNPILDYVGICHLLEDRGCTIRVLSFWDQCLEALGFWYDQLLSESLGKQEKGATPITAVNTRDLHSRGQQHQEGRRDKLITNVILKNVRREPLPVGLSDNDLDRLNDIGNWTLPEIMNAALQATTRAYQEDRRPTADIHLPAADEASLGQLYQMLMLSTGLEGYLVGTNPYGQPGVEAYKKHMKSILRGDKE